MRVPVILFWLMQALLASVLAVPFATALIGGGPWFREFLPWFAATFVIVALATFIAQLLRINERPGAGALVLLLGIAPFALVFWYLLSFARNWQ